MVGLPIVAEGIPFLAGRVRIGNMQIVGDPGRHREDLLHGDVCRFRSNREIDPKIVFLIEFAQGIVKRHRVGGDELHGKRADVGLRLAADAHGVAVFYELVCCCIAFSR